MAEPTEIADNIAMNSAGTQGQVVPGPRCKSSMDDDVLATTDSHQLRDEILAGLSSLAG